MMLILASVSLLANADEIKLKKGDRFHITGCENGRLYVPIVNQWDRPGGLVAGARVTGRLAGDGRLDQNLKCQGAIVELLDTTELDGKVYLKVQSVVNGKVGWITDSFVGRVIGDQ